jgi:predicted ATPase
MVRMLWFLGAPDQARQRSHDATTLAQEIAHPFSLALAYTFAALGSQLRREGQTTQEWAEQAMVVCTKHGFAFYSAMGAILRGWALVEQGQGSEGIEQLRHGLAAWQATGSELFRPHLLALLAEAYGRVGEAKEGLAVLANALPTAPLGGMRFYEAELHRLKGELTLQQFKVQSSEFKVPSTQHPTPSTHAEAEAEACFLKAIEVARQQQAKSWELRASTSLARLWRQQGKLHEARAIVSEIYNWFTEGFDTKDLQEAKALLEEPS